ncbi:hypothetical protein SBOR_1133 [Sclerotinia borealis F-4128]|uniref:BZIP domain-containing protein n=1 Tax=Sclerotinia borealis (strain F-4128) TaxID=1432307 RepID=W9CRJ1_SCLBF|nr:hypothetical protein SBOR_1133 [Sclerotinia borealis F-4128]
MSQSVHSSNGPVGSDGEGPSHSDSVNATDKKVGEVKRVSRAGTRSVLNLSPTRLARKRANDREAQRNIRSRNKEHIERLEARVEELTKGRSPDVELEEVHRQNEALVGEVRRLSESLAQLRTDDNSITAQVYGFNLARSQRCQEVSDTELMSRILGIIYPAKRCSLSANWMATVVVLLKPLIVHNEWSLYNANQTSQKGSDGSTALNYLRDTNVSSSSTRDIPREISTTRPIDSQTFETLWYQQPGNSRSSTGASRRSFSTAFGPIDGVPQVNGPASMSALDETSRFSYFDPNHQVNFNDAGNWARKSVPSDALQNPNLATIPGHTQSQPQPRQTQPFNTSNMSSRPEILSPLQQFQANHGISFSTPQPLQPWDIPILNTSTPTCGVDTLLMNIIRTQKEMAQQGASIAQIIGPPQPSMKAIIYPEDPNQTHIASTMISNLLTNLAVRGLPERAGCLYLMYHICQWQIHPSSSTYGYLTDWSSPRPSQLITAHPVWADSIFWGKLRDKVIENQERYANEEFQNAYILCINANWPRPDLEAFRFEGNDIYITEDFETHIRNLSNWSLDERFAARYPELAPLVNISGAGEIGLQGPYVV